MEEAPDGAGRTRVFVPSAPLFSVINGALAISQPLAVSVLAGPSGSQLNLGPSVSTGPVMVALEGFTQNPLPAIRWAA